MTARIPAVPTLFLSTLALVSPAGAVVIADTDFSTALSGLTFDASAAGNSGGYGTAGPNGTRAIDLIDTLSPNNASVARFTPPGSNPFSTASAGQSNLLLSFDMAVANLGVATANSNSLPRFILRNTVTATQGLTIAVGRDNFNNLVLYAAKGDAVTPSTSGALTYSFGAYDETTLSNNDTNGYVSFAISLTHGGTSINVMATQGATTLFNGAITGYSALSLSNTNTSLIMATGLVGTSEMYIDNLVMQTVPEPGSIAFSASAVALLAFRRSRGK